MDRTQAAADPCPYLLVPYPVRENDGASDTAHLARCQAARRPYIVLSPSRGYSTYQIWWDTSPAAGMSWPTRQRLLRFLADLPEAARPSNLTLGFRVGCVRGVPLETAQALAELLLREMSPPLFGWAELPPAELRSSPAKKSEGHFTTADVGRGPVAG